MSGDGSTHIYALKNPEEFSLQGNPEAFQSQYLSFSISKCNNATSQEPCADFGTNEEKLIEYLSKHNIALLSANSYVDFDEVDPFKGPVKQYEVWGDV